MFRFTIRDLLLATLVVAIALTGIANYRPLTVVAQRWSTAVWNGVAKAGPPLTGRDSAPKALLTPEGPNP
jgi:hypothetical protein